MRALAKGPKPPILVAQGEKWQAELAAVLAAGERPTEVMRARYRHPEIKDAILAETANKCAYCESKIRHVTYGDIEHIIPKSRVPAKSYEWSNLTLACDICNTNKGDFYSDDPEKSQDGLVDPYVDDPRAHFLFMREVVTPRPDSLKGYATEQVLKLTRGQLIERRRERMNFIDGMVMAYTLADPEYKSVILQTLYDNHLKEDDEYAGIVAAYIEHLQSLGTLPIA